MQGGDLGVMLDVFDDWPQQSIEWARRFGFSERRRYLRTTLEVLPMGVAEQDTQRQSNRVCNGIVGIRCFGLVIFQGDEVDFNLLVVLIRK